MSYHAFVLIFLGFNYFHDFYVSDKKYHDF